MGSNSFYRLCFIVGLLVVGQAAPTPAVSPSPMPLERSPAPSPSPPYQLTLATIAFDGLATDPGQVNNKCVKAIQDVQPWLNTYSWPYEPDFLFCSLTTGGYKMDIVIRDDATTPGALLRTRLEELRNSSAPREALVQAMNTTCGALVYIEGAGMKLLLTGAQANGTSASSPVPIYVAGLDPSVNCTAANQDYVNYNAPNHPPMLSSPSPPPRPQPSPPASQSAIELCTITVGELSFTTQAQVNAFLSNAVNTCGPSNRQQFNSNTRTRNRCCCWCSAPSNRFYCSYGAATVPLAKDRAGAYRDACLN